MSLPSLNVSTNPIGRIRLAAAFVLLAGLSANAQAQERPSLGVALRNGTPLVDVRLRDERVDDENCAACGGRHGEATTLRVRLGYGTAPWHGLSAQAAFDQIWALGPERYNSTANGRSGYPVVADPVMTTLDRLAVSYAAGRHTMVTAGRQPIVLGNSRFIGDVGFRQHEQTFDAVKLVNTAPAGLTTTYAWVGGVNRVFHPGSTGGPTTGYFNSHSHILDGVFTGVAHLTLEGYAYLLSLRQAPTGSTATGGLRGAWHPAPIDGLNVGLGGAFARQTGYGPNPAAVSLDYWALDGSASYSTVTAGLGYEAMGGNGSVGFATPLATLHAFDGWADLFLTTPKDGIDDLHASLTVALPHGPSGVTLTPSAVFHTFTTDRTSVPIGHEWDVSLAAAVTRHFGVSVAYAGYTGGGIGAGGFRSKTIGWITASYRR